MVNLVQVKMPRVALGGGVRDLAHPVGLTSPTSTKLETDCNVEIESVENLQRALKRAGITWVPENGGLAGVMPPRHERAE